VICQHKKIRRDAYWFGESQSRVVVSIKKEKQVAFLQCMEGISIEKLGEVTSSAIEVDGEKWGNIREWKYEYETAIEKEMQSIVEA
jgi:phosphoribosylformylglycinamidine synthase subunit PurL